MDTNEKPSYWAVIPASVRYDEELSPSAKLLYAEISSLTGETGYCYASNQYFAVLYHLSERTIIRLLKELRDHGYIRIEDGDGGAALRKVFAGLNPLTKMSPPPDKNVTPPPTKMSPVSEKNNNINPPKAPQKGARSPKSTPEWEPECFEAFWKLYPRGADRCGAVREWDRLKPDRTLMKTMGSALKKQMASPEWSDVQYIPHARRWLRERRWTDEDRSLPEPEVTWAYDPEVGA